MGKKQASYIAALRVGVRVCGRREAVSCNTALNSLTLSRANR
jgi:hypothetical protein